MARISTGQIGGASCCTGIEPRNDPRHASAPRRADERSTASRPSRIIRLPAGRARIGVDNSPLPQDGEGPARLERLRSFSIDPHAVTNAWFGAFVDATGHQTNAERHGWSLVFAPFVSGGAPAMSSSQGPAWWRRVEGACWRQPEGPQSDVAARSDHPVVHVSWSDAAAFAAWAGARLPTEAEWEYAAKGGLEHARFPWGDAEPDETDFQPCNIWQGQFPVHNTQADGHLGTAPVDTYAPNGYGLFNMAGNTWEWCADAFRVRSVSRNAKQRNEAARLAGDRVLKGGSYLCHRSYCYRYRIAARSGVSADSSTGHVGFRVAYDD